MAPCAFLVKGLRQQGLFNVSMLLLQYTPPTSVRTLGQVRIISG